MFWSNYRFEIRPMFHLRLVSLGYSPNGRGILFVVTHQMEPLILYR